jgi:hypothetical protein
MINKSILIYIHYRDVVKQPTTQPLSPIKTNHGNQTTNQV